MDSHKQDNDSVYETFLKAASISIIAVSIIIALSIAVNVFDVSIFTPSKDKNYNEVISVEAPVIIVETPREVYIKDLSELKTLDEKIIYILTNGKK